MLKDLKKFQKFSSMLYKNPEFLKEFPCVLAELVTDYFSVNEKTKEEVEKEVIRKFNEKLGFCKFSRIMFGLAQAMGWI